MVIARKGSKPTPGLVWIAIASALLLTVFRLADAFLGDAPRRWLDTYLHSEDWITNILVFWSLTLLLYACHLWRSALHNQEHIEAIIRSVSPDVLLIVQPDRTISMCNPAIKFMFGYEAGPG